jgi:hypothetical protein
VFDAPDAFSACTRRIRSNTPLQALTLLNDEAFVEFAQALAERILQEGPGAEPARVDFAFRLCLARLPAPDEKQRLLNLLEAESAAFGQAPHEAALLSRKSGEVSDLTQLAAWTTVSRVLLNLDETITRE